MDEARSSKRRRRNDDESQLGEDAMESYYGQLRDYDPNADISPTLSLGDAAYLGSGWRMIAKFSQATTETCNTEDHRNYYTSEDSWTRCWHDGGYFIAVHSASGVAFLSRYESGNGCSSCGFGGLESEDGIWQARRGKHLLWLGFRTMLRHAQQRIDPCMTARKLQPGDEHNEAITTLYYLYKRRFTKHLVQRGRRYSVHAAWDRECECWDLDEYKSLIKLQALARGWLVRQRLWSPYHELGKRRLEQQWRKLQEGS